MPSTDLRTRPVDGVMQSLNQGGPVDLGLVADHLQSRQAAAFDDSVAVVGRLQTTHLADRALQCAIEAYLLVAEGLEQFQHGTLQAGGNPAATDRSEVVHGALADPPAAAGEQAGLECDRAPADQPQVVDGAVEPAGNAAEVEYAGDLRQVELLQRNVAAQHRIGSERLLQRKSGDVHVTVEQAGGKATLQLEAIVDPAQRRDRARERTREGWPAYRLAEGGHVDPGQHQ